MCLILVSETNICRRSTAGKFLISVFCRKVKKDSSWCEYSKHSMQVDQCTINRTVIRWSTRIEVFFSFAISQNAVN